MTLLTESEIEKIKETAGESDPVDAINRLLADREELQRQNKALSETIDSQKQTHDALIKRCKDLEADHGAMKGALGFYGRQDHYVIDGDGGLVSERLIEYGDKARETLSSLRLK